MFSFYKHHTRCLMRKLSEIDELLKDSDLVNKWIEIRNKEKVLINVTDVNLKYKVHKTKYQLKLPEEYTEVTGAIIVTPDFNEEGKYVLLRGWRIFKFAQLAGQEKINAYITHTGRVKFAMKLQKIKEDMEKEKENTI